MASPRYPLARVGELRAEVATERVRDLASALADEVEAEAALAGTAAAVARLQAAIAAAGALAGPRPAWALAQRDAYAARLRRDLDRARAAQTSAAAALAERRTTTAAARGAAATARAERDTIERHRTDWDDAQRKTRERRED
ncbi:MAG: hypothetical protein IPL61_26030 [Myxococcales bacterium]|nr:hypothetical protein [Myxococcales bacterium]